MKVGVVACGLLLLVAGSAIAGDDEACATAGNLVHADFSAPRVAEGIARKNLKVLVVGTTSSMIGGPNSTSKAYPVRLQEDLIRRLPGVAVKVTTFAKPRETAAEAEKALEGLVTAEKPDLVVWQTGTFDAMRSVDIDEFRLALSDGVDTLQTAHADVVLMNMQYSPRTESMIAVGSYADTMRLVALQHEILLFDRFAVMKQWNELATFDLYAATKKTDVAERVHDCIGRLLGGLAVDAAAKAGVPRKGTN
jgi:GDSL-like Lipase/Acylhydrolase family